VDGAGNTVSGATITVRRAVGGEPLAALFTNRAASISLGNPFTAEDDGTFRFFVNSGTYHIEAKFGEFTRTWDYVDLGDMAGRSASEFLPISGGVLSGPLEATELIAQANGTEGGQVRLLKPEAGSSLAGDLLLDIVGDLFRMFEDGGTHRGAAV